MPKMLAPSFGLLALWAAPVASYAPIIAIPRAPTSPFSAAGLQLHATDVAEQCPAPAIELPARLEIAAPPRALPKRGTGGDDEAEDPNDPFGLWKPAAPKPPRGPSVYKLNQGRAIDMLRRDYPAIFTAKPDLSIFTEKVELHDPNGKRLSGLKSYDKIFDMLRFLRRTTMQDAQVTYRLVVVEERIRVRWTAKCWMRDPALGLTENPLDGTPAVVHIDGVSNYDLDAEGKIYRHTVENLILKGQDAAEPVQLALAWPSGLTLPGMPVPELAVPTGMRLRALDPSRAMSQLPAGLAQLFTVVSSGEEAAAQPQPQPQPSAPPQPTRFAAPARPRGGAPQASAVGGGETPMERAARERAEDAAKAERLAEMRSPKEQSSSQRGLFGLTAPQSCETSYDCEQPLVCCDLLFGSVCCTGGLMIPTVDAKAALQRQAIPIPVEVDDGLPRPPNGGGNAPQYPGPPM